MSSRQSSLSGRRVLVTGGTGFIGGRLVARLVLECDANVRVLVRNFAHAPQIARFPIEMVYGDVTDSSDVKRAVDGCEVVFHCAATAQGSKEIQYLVNVEGTRNVLEAARCSQPNRVIHLSSLMVYGRNLPDGDLDETAPRRYSGGAYSDTKLDAEELAFRYVEEYGLPIVVLQPTGVYGPHGGTWTTRTLHRLKTERLVLVNGGDGLCNAVYVDDLVSAMLLAAAKEKVVGEAFLISDGQTVTWREFFGRYARMLSSVEMVDMSATEVLQAYQAQRRRKARGIVRETLSVLREERHVRQRMLRTSEAVALRKVVRLLVPKRIRQSLKGRFANRGRSSGLPVESESGTPIGLWSPLEVQFYVLKTRVRIDKARRMLGYEPAFDLESGMRLTEQWARWANLI
jgi:nucleoside-diphosphate-sugar epimerase